MFLRSDHSIIVIFCFVQVEGGEVVVEEGGEMVVDVTEVVDGEGSHQQIYFHQPITTLQGGDPQQTYTVVQKQLETSQHVNMSQVPPTVSNVQNITGFEVMY